MLIVKALERKRPRPQRPWDRETPNVIQLVRPDAQRGRHATSAPKTSRVVRPDLTFQVERFADIATELPPLFERHHKELFDLSHIAALEPDWPQYFALDAVGRLRIMTARYGDVLAGYIINVIGNHIMSRNFLFSCIEKFYLDIPYRGSGFAKKWFDANDADLKSIGVKAVCVAEKLGTHAGILFKRMGYKPIETVWLREL